MGILRRLLAWVRKDSLSEAYTRIEDTHERTMKGYDELIHQSNARSAGVRLVAKAQAKRWGFSDADADAYAENITPTRQMTAGPVDY